MSRGPRQFVGRAPADVEAVRWFGEGDPDGASTADLNAWGVEWKTLACRCASRPTHPSPHFVAVWDSTIKGWAHVRPGSWVIRRLDGTFTALPADTFAERYTPAPAGASQ